MLKYVKQQYSKFQRRSKYSSAIDQSFHRYLERNIGILGSNVPLIPIPLTAGYGLPLDLMQQDCFRFSRFLIWGFLGVRVDTIILLTYGY